jgi:ketosteroid isomerase-like protein
MRNFLVLILLSVCLVACSGGSTESTSAPKDSAVAAAPAVSLPYTAEYSSNFVAGKPSDVAAVLENYKAWETNDMKGLRATFGDSVEFYFPNGFIFKGTGDSAVKMAAKYRDSLSKVVLTFYAWTSNHSVDKNEDWVNVWYKEVDTYKTGKVDSTDYEDDNRVVNGKIVWGSSHKQSYMKKK